MKFEETGSHEVLAEPEQAFPYTPPSDELRKRYDYIFTIDEPIPHRMIKVLFDKALGALLLVLSLPVLLLLKIAYMVEGLIIPENAGPMFFFYWGVSGGKRIKKWKLRLIKQKFIDPVGAANHEWIAFSSEWNESSRTHVGAFVKKWYLDELPQFWSVLKGDMSIVGPRPLSEMHYERDLAQGNKARKLLRGGMLGLGHINKGTDEMGDAKYEYEYIDNCIKYSSFALLRLDLWIIWRGIVVIARGGGH